jgi:hypothetical protein
MHKSLNFIETGGVIFYTIILNIRSDVFCSVITEWDYSRTKCSGPYYLLLEI